MSHAYILLSFLLAVCANYKWRTFPKNRQPVVIDFNEYK